MADLVLKFRTATFGGFHRQDVVEYIESNAKEHAAQLNALRTELAEARQRITVLEGEEARAIGLQDLNFALSARVDTLAPLEEEVAALRAEVEALRPQAEAYAGLKESMADIELEARARASLIRKDAETAAARTSADAEAEAQRVLAQAQAEAADIRARAEAEVSEIRAQAETEVSGIRAQAEAEATESRAQAAELLRQARAERERVGSSANDALANAISMLSGLRSSFGADPADGGDRHE